MSLLEAIQTNNLAKARELITARANIKSDEGKFGLLEAAKKGNLEIVRLLIDSGIDVNRPPRRQENYTVPLEGTALRVAVAQSHLDIVKALVAAGADVNHIPTRSFFLSS